MSEYPQHSKEAGQQPLTAANLQALEPTLTGQHEVLGRFVGGSNSLIDRAELQAIFRANDVLGDAANINFFNALLEQHAPTDPASGAKIASSIGPLIGNVAQSNDGIVPPDPDFQGGFGRLSSEFDYPLGGFNESQWLSQATDFSAVGSIKGPVMSMAEELGEPISPNGRLEGEGTSIETSAGLSAGGAFRPRCGRASAEFLRGNGMVGQVGQLSQLYAPTQQAGPPAGVLPQGMQGMLGGRGGGLVGALPYGGIGQIPEHPETQLSHSGQIVYGAQLGHSGPLGHSNLLMHIGASLGHSGPLGHSGSYMPRPAPRMSGNINHLIGPLPTSHEPAAPAPMQYGVGGMPVGMHGMVGQYPSVGQSPSYSSLGGYQMHAQPQHQVPGAYPTGSMAQMDDRARRATYPNGFGMHQRQADARQMFGQQSGGPPVSHIGTTSQHMSDSGGRNVGEISQQSLANSLHAPKVSAAQFHQESPRSHEMSQGLLVQQQLHPSGGGGSLEGANGRPPAKMNSIQSADTVSMQAYSDPSEDAAAALASSASMQSRPGSKVRVVCSANGHFIKQASGHYEYEGGDTRLVGISSASSLPSLKEALNRVVTKAGTGSTSASGSPEMMFLKYQLPSEPNVYVDLLDDEDVSLMFDEWADFAAQHKGTSYKLHVYVAWAKELAGDLTNGSQTDLLDAAGISAGSVSDDDVSKPSKGEVDEWSLIQMAGRMEIISIHDISLAKFLGSGGYGEVYLGKWHSSEVAIKCLNPSLFFSGSDGTASKAAMADLLREADLLASLRHPNVVWVYGVVLPRMGPDDRGNLMMEDVEPIPITSGANLGRTCSNLRPPAVVTEFMSQGSVKSALARKSEVVVGNMHRVVVAMDAAKGMEYLHQKRIVHFDLKSANLLLGYRDRRAVCKVADFGLSKQKRDTYVSNVTSQRGTLPWIAPEIIKTPHAVTEKVDVYSFGIVMWELWTGKEPYEGLNYHALLHQIMLTNGGLRPPIPNGPKWEGDNCPEPAPGWAGLMERCWHELPEERPGFDEIVRELKMMAQALRPPRNRAKAVAAASISSAELDARGIPSGRPKPSTTQAQQAFHMPTHTLTRKDSSQHGSAPAVQAQQAQQAFHMPGTIVSRKNSPNMPTVGEDSSDSGGATAKAEALYAPVQASPAPGPGAEAAPAAQKPESSAAPDSAQSAESSSGPAAVPVAVRPPLPHVPSDPQLKREPLQAQLRKEQSEAELAEAAQKLHAVSIVESITDSPSQPGAAAARPAELRGGQGAQAPAAPETAGETEMKTDSAPGAPLAGQQPDEVPAVSAAHVHQQVASAFQQPNPNPFSSAFAYTERMNSAFTSN
ncbi:g4432 [Coccomyxa viridis]|uniref:G4432 protein n=1 Tax=Coccomyxa viridis TaxID=1274662 RepID=A0ABP1FRS8_9CHLO